MKAIFRRELLAYFTSPLGYVFLSVFYIFAGIFLYFTSLSTGVADLSNTFYFLFIILILLTPILTMRILSEEKKQKTDQLLLSSPITLTGLVMGKFLAAFLVYALGVVITLVYAVVLSIFATLQWSVIIGNIVGLLLNLFQAKSFYENYGDMFNAFMSAGFPKEEAPEPASS